MHALIAASTEGRLVAFVGAGISMIPPTCLPSWWDVNESVIIALADRAAPLIGPERSANLARTVSVRQKSDRFPPEYQAELLASRLGASYFRVLQCLDSDRPNAVHLRLASLASAGHLAAIVTTNFDRAMEAAFRAVGAPVRTCARAADFDALAPELERGSGRIDGCVLLKLHGSADDPATLIDTLAQRKRGLPDQDTLESEGRRRGPDLFGPSAGVAGDLFLRLAPTLPGIDRVVCSGLRRKQCCGRQVQPVR